VCKKCPSYPRRTTTSYAQFVFISKEIGALKKELGESLSAWKMMLSVPQIEESQAASITGLFFVS
jgi:hypothetical protein